MQKNTLRAFFLLAIGLTISSIASASTDTQPDMDWFVLVSQLTGGLALFLYGMEMLSSGLKKTAGNGIRKIISRLTNNRFMGLLIGALVTMIIQSSSATTVMLVSFVQSGLMSFAQSLGVILGANIGTTFTAQIIAFKITKYAVLMIAIGFVLRLSSKRANIKNIGDTTLGFGLLFFGMQMMSDAMYPLRSYPGFLDLLKSLELPVAGILAGAVFTAIIQSSSAFTGIIIVLAQQNLISIEAGIPLIMGANIGTCVTAALASIGASREAKRVAVAHTIFNVGGALLFVFFIPSFVDLIDTIASQTDSDMARKIANAHTIFNIATAILFIPFTPLIARLSARLLPDRPQPENQIPLRFLAETDIPAIALVYARAEIARISHTTFQMLKVVIMPFENRKWRAQKDELYPHLSTIEALDMRETKVDYLEEKVVEYLHKIGQSTISKGLVDEMSLLISVANDLEHIADIVHRNFEPLATKYEQLAVPLSDDGRNEVIDFHKKVCKQMTRVTQLLDAIDFKKMGKVLEKGEKYDNLEAEYRLKHIQRLSAGKAETMATHEVHMELMDMLKQINMYCRNIAYTVQETQARP